MLTFSVTNVLMTAWLLYSLNWLMSKWEVWDPTKNDIKFYLRSVPLPWVFYLHALAEIKVLISEHHLLFGEQSNYSSMDFNSDSAKMILKCVLGTDYLLHPLVLYKCN